MVDFSFNLVDEPWIPCAGLDGTYRSCGLRELFLHAHELRSIENQNPLTEAALLRLLLAIVHRAIDGPRDGRSWKELYIAGSFDERVTEYLGKWHHRFDLFSREKPFYQTPGLIVVDSKSGEDVPQPVALLMIERASGNNKTLFDHTNNDTPVRLSPAEAACALITAQMFSLGGLNRKTTNLFGLQLRFEDSLMTKGVFVALTGGNLFETLLLNLLIYNDNEPIPNTPEDRPVWERNDIGGTGKITPKGYMHILTPKCRHILLVPEHDKCGDIFIEHVYIAQGEEFIEEVTDPGFISRRNNKGEWYHLRLTPDRLVWRDSLALFSFDEQHYRRPKVFRQAQSMRGVVTQAKRYDCKTYALINEKGPTSNPLAWRSEKLNIPFSLLSEREMVAYLEKGMQFSESAAGVLQNAVKTFMRIYLPENTKKKDITAKAAATGAVRAYWDHLEGHFHRFLLDLDEQEKALEAWLDAVKQTARESLYSCLGGRYAGSARTYRAWSEASVYLNKELKVRLDG